MILPFITFNDPVKGNITSTCDQSQPK